VAQPGGIDGVTPFALGQEQGPARRQGGQLRRQEGIGLLAVEIARVFVALVPTVSLLSGHDSSESPPKRKVLELPISGC